MKAKPSTRTRRQPAKGKRRTDNPDDPFAGWPPTPVRCRWLSADDEVRAARARVVRLLVDWDRNEYGWANEVYQRRVLRDIAAFIGPTNAVLMTPGGMIATAAPELTSDAAGLAAGLAAIDAALRRLDLGQAPPETLLGFDVCLPCRAVPLQTVVHVAGRRPAVTLDNVTVKAYPMGEEAESLVGWWMARAAGDVPAELAPARLAQTRAGSVLALICHDACLFSARSRAKLTDGVGLRIREHLEQAAAAGRARLAALRGG